MRLAMVAGMRRIGVLVGLAACGGGAPSTNHAPVADLAAGTSVTAGEPLAFDAGASSDPDGDTLRYSWSFGDGGRGGAVKMAHVFASAGSYTVTLRVADGRGGVDETTQLVTVAAAPPPTSTVTATVRVSSPTGDRLSGASVRVLDGASATTDADGLATIAIGAGASQVLRVELQGYARQTRPLTLPDEDPFVDVVLYPAGAMLALDDAAAGGSVAGADGATVELPAGALIDDTGAAVSGAVDVAMTPLDVVSAGAAFPGKFEGIDGNGASGTLLSWGTMDVAFSQDGRHLNLAPGETATIEIPVYAGLALDGSPVRAGDAFPLWSLDETTGVWIQEGQGTVVASTGSPTGLALRGEVGHFSWWNCDAVGPTHATQTKCCIDGNFDGQCDGDTICYVRGRTNCAGSYCAADGKPDGTPMAPPAYSATAVVGAGETLSLKMPSAFPVMLEGYAQNGTLYGKALILSTTDAATIHLGPIDEPLPTQMITLPWDHVYIATAGTLARFTYDAPAAKTALVTVTRGEGSLLEGIVTLRGSRGETLEHPMESSRTCA